MKPPSPRKKKSPAARSYARRLALRAPRERVFVALTTLAGLRRWWTADVRGSTRLGGTIRFGFRSVDEWIEMRVDEAQPPSHVRWTCVGRRHAGKDSGDEWIGTEVDFTLTARGSASCGLRFRHRGLTPRLACYDDCEVGWNHFLASLASLVERGAGNPFED